MAASMAAAGAQAPAAAVRPAPPSIIAEVRALIAKGDFDGGDAALDRFVTANGRTSESLEALSWLGRGALAADLLDRADAYAKQAQRLSEEALASRALDADRYLPIALGAAFEVQAHVLARTERRSEAIYLLNRALESYGTTSIRARLQKNVHLLSLEGKPAPALTATEFLGPARQLAELKGRPVLLFFWAHWCPDCKMQAPLLDRLEETYRARGLVVLAPTQRYGYIKRGTAASPADEGAHIDRVRLETYGGIDNLAVTISQEDFANYGASTTPTLVLVDRAGIVRLYHPGRMTPEDLEPRVRAVVEAGGPQTSADDATLAAVGRFNAAVNRQDLAALSDEMAEDIVFENTNPQPDGMRYEGKEAVRAFWAKWFAANPGATFEAEETIVAGDRCIVRWVYRKMREGKPWHLRGIDVFRVRDGRVAEKLSYVKG
jgi:ketosteroid isomerase-like protein